MNDILTSRFFCTDDAAEQEFVFQLPIEWWSRKFEYPWAGQFSDTSAVVLDAACGIEHPLKFYLLDHCKRTYACDLNPGLTQPGAIKKITESTFNLLGKQAFPERYLQEIQYNLASLTALPYEDQMFDRVFCISVLEHLKDRFNRYPALRMLRPLGAWMRQDIHDSLIEFKRVLKPYGLIVLTFDYPRINLNYLRWVVEDVGLRFAGNINFNLPHNALYCEEKNLYCFRAVLTPKE